MDGSVIRYRKLLNNKLLRRLQMTVEILHPNSGGISKDKLKEHIAKSFKTKTDNIVVYGMSTANGGGRTSGFALIYDEAAFLKKYEPKYRLTRMGMAPPKTGGRKARKELKNKKKKVRGVKKAKVGVGKKR